MDILDFRKRLIEELTKAGIAHTMERIELIENVTDLALRYAISKMDEVSKNVLAGLRR